MDLMSVISEVMSKNASDSALMLLLIISVIFGIFCKRVENVKMKKWLGTGFGLLTLFLLGGFTHSWHILTIGILCAIVIRYIDKRKCHIAAFIIMFSYLGIFRLIIMTYTNMKKTNTYMYITVIQMMLTCKLVGVAFEIKKSKKVVKEKNSQNDEGNIDPSVPDILHYGFSFLGMVSGPYIRYRTFDDYLHLSFSRIVGIDVALKKVGESLLLASIFIVLQEIWPVEYTLTKEFNDSNLAYKILFTIIQFQRIFVWLTIGMKIAEGICAGAGLGAYPIQGVNITSYGPTEAYGKIREISYSEAEKMAYDFNTLNSKGIAELLTTPWILAQTCSWDIIQHLLAMHIIFKSSPEIKRFFVAFFISAFWHGLDPGYYIALLTIPSYMLTERLYRSLYESVTGWKSNALLLFIFIAKFYIIGNGLIVLKMLEMEKIKIYLMSTNFLPYQFHIFIHAAGSVAAWHQLKGNH